MMTKAQNERRHFARRANERLGLAINRGEIEEIIRFIQQGGAEFVERASSHRTLWGVCLKGADCVVVYDSKRKTLVTVLPRQKFDRRSR